MMNTTERLDRIVELQDEAEAIVQIMKYFKGGSFAPMQDSLNDIRKEIAELENDDACELFIANVERHDLY
jgi:hypothetical protein